MGVLEPLENDVIRVAPYLSSFNSSIISRLKSPVSESIVKSSFSVPLYKSVDATKLLKDNNTRILQNAAISASKSGPAPDNDVSPEDDYDKMQEDPQHHVEVSQILPQNRADQLSILLIHYFPNVKKHLVEAILDAFLGQKTNHSLYTWSSVNNEFLEHTNLFLKFENLSTLKWFYSSYKDSIHSLLNSKKCTILSDNELNAHLDSICAAELVVDFTEVNSVISRILGNPQNLETASSHTGTEDLDKVMSFYKDYKVDNNELVDVPGSMKDNIVREIVGFRTKMLSIERENRKQEIEQERLKTKERLKRIFEDVRETHTEGVGATEAGDSDSDSDSISDAEFEELNDQEYQEYLNLVKAEAMEKEYQARLELMKVREKSEREILLTRLAQLKNYEDQLIENKLEYIDEVKASFKFISEGPDGDITSLPRDSLLRLYFSDHLRYLSMREAQRDAEANSDDIDRELEIAANVKVTENHESRSEPLTDSHPSANKPMQGMVISELSSEHKNKLQQKIKDLIAEYLGIHDDFLMEVINTSLTTHDLNGKDELVADLTEVLDDDAANLVNDLWNFINQLQ